MALTTSGCAMIGGMVRNEQKGPDGLLVRGGGVPCYQPGKLIPVGYTTFTVTSVPKSYEPFLDLNDGRSTVEVANTPNTNAPSGVDAQKEALLNLGLLQASGSFAIEAGNRGERPSGDFGAAKAYDHLKSHASRVDRENLSRRIPNGGSANVAFIHEVVEVGEPEETIQLEAFGKVLSVSTNNEGEMTGQSREPVYTVTVPIKERLVAIATDAKTGQEIARGVYATWNKKAKYYQNKERKYFPDEAAAMASYQAEKGLFRTQLEKAPLVDTNYRKTFKAIKELPVSELNVMSPDEAWGVYFATDLQPYFALPDTTEPAVQEFTALSEFFEMGNMGWSLKKEWDRNPAWIDGFEKHMRAVADNSNASSVARAAANLNLANAAFSRLDGASAKSYVQKAQAIHPDCLAEKNAYLGRGGMLDYGSDYYVARYLWLNIDTGVQSVATSTTKRKRH